MYDGNSYEVEIDADSVGSTTVLGCSVLRAVSKVDCFKKFAFSEVVRGASRRLDGMRFPRPIRKRACAEALAARSNASQTRFRAFRTFLARFARVIVIARIASFVYAARLEELLREGTPGNSRENSAGQYIRTSHFIAGSPKEP